jgi:hypothetical protein
MVRDALADTLVTDIIVLAKIAQEVAVSEKNGPGTVLSHQGGLLSEMGIKTSHNCLGAGLAITDSPACAIDPALPRAQGAIGKPFHCSLGFNS